MLVLMDFYMFIISLVAGCHIQDPQVSGWLLDPADPSSSYQDLLHKHSRTRCTSPVQTAKKVSENVS